MDNNPAQNRFPHGIGDSSAVNLASTVQVEEKVVSNPNYGMWLGFVQIIHFISLYFLATSVANILHEAVNRFISDPLEVASTARSYLGLLGYGNFSDYWLRYNVAALIVSFPVFIFLFLYIKSSIVKDSRRADLRIRHILTYITLVGTFLFFNYALIKVFYAVLDGTLNQRSIFHASITVGISALIFIYYLVDVKGDRR